MKVEVLPGMRVGDYVNQLIDYIAEAALTSLASTVARIWIEMAQVSAMSRELAQKVAELALLSYGLYL
jgi:hypothetical protein